MTALSIRGLRKGFGVVPVLHGVDLDVAAGTTTAILGPSGCGKTTLLRLIAGFDRPDAGTITVGGRQMSSGRSSVAAHRRDIGYVAQEGALFPHLTVAANITFGLPRSVAGRRDRAGQLLELVSLDPALAARYPHQLSGGQQQRVALARALARKPALVLLDEPFSSLDSTLRETTRNAVAAALAAENVTALLVTHDQHEALSMADHVAVMHAGAFTQTGTPRELYSHPACLGTALMLGPASTVDATVRAGVAVCALGEVKPANACPDGRATVLIRPEHLHVAAGAAGHGISATVQKCEYFGADTAVTAALPDGTVVRARAAGTTWYRPGQPVTVTLAGPAHAYPRHPSPQPDPNRDTP